MNRLTFDWVSREMPLTSTAVVTKGKSSVSLIKKMVSRPLNRHSHLKGCYTGSYVILTGNEMDLPWVDGASYYGSDPDAPSLLLPTHSRPSIHAGLIEKAFSSHMDSGPYILIPEDKIIISVAHALPLSKKAMQAWIEVCR